MLTEAEDLVEKYKDFKGIPASMKLTQAEKQNNPHLDKKAVASDLKKKGKEKFKEKTRKKGKSKRTTKKNKNNIVIYNILQCFVKQKNKQDAYK